MFSLQIIIFMNYVCTCLLFNNLIASQTLQPPPSLFQIKKIPKYQINHKSKDLHSFLSIKIKVYEIKLQASYIFFTPQNEEII